MADRQMQFIAASVLILSAIIGVGSHIGAAHLERETRKQCRTNDWPAEQHDAHIHFCTAYGYPVR